MPPRHRLDSRNQNLGATRPTLTVFLSVWRLMFHIDSGKTQFSHVVQTVLYPLEQFGSSQSTTVANLPSSGNRTLHRKEEKENSTPFMYLYFDNEHGMTKRRFIPQLNSQHDKAYFIERAGHLYRLEFMMLIP